MAAAAATMMLGAFGAQGQMAQGASSYNALSAQAGMQEANADEALRAGQYNATRAGMISEHKIGTSQASYGASGVSNTGSVLEVLRNSAQNAELDRMNILHGADVKAINYRNQAALDRFGAENAMVGARWAAMGSLTSGMLKGWTMGTAGASNAGSVGGGVDYGGDSSAGYGEGAGLS